jgi:hypothetical protein
MVNQIIANHKILGCSISLHLQVHKYAAIECKNRYTFDYSGQARANAIASILQSTYRLYIVCRCYTEAQYLVCPNGNVKGLLNLGIFGENSWKIGGNHLTKAGRVCYNIDATLKIG